MAGTDGDDTQRRDQWHGDAFRRDGLAFDVSAMPDTDHVTVVLRGEIDLAAVQAVRDAVDHAISSGDRVIMDLGAVTFIDSSGLRVVVESRRAHPDRVSIGPCSDAVAMVIELTGLADVLGA